MPYLLLIFISLLLSTSLSAQTISPVINQASHRVTFRLYAPKAKKVKVEGTFITPTRGFHHKTITLMKRKPVEMQRDGDYWTYTTDSLASEMYTYRFLVDKKDSLDPNNPRKLRDIDDWYNYFFIDGELASHYEDQDIPHGRLDTIWYPSTLNGMSQRRMIVYTPHGYDSLPDRHYPVLYLLHGSGGDETSWTDYGRARQILDDMIARQQSVPVIVVMPNGNVTLDAAPGESPWMDKKPSANNVSSMMGKYEKSFVPEIVNYIDANYRTIPDKAHRAIAGLSLGGLHTIYISANNPTYFDYVGLFSAQTTNVLNTRGASAVVSTTRNALQNLRNIVSIIKGNVPEDTGLTEKLRDTDIYEHTDEKLQAQFATPPALYYIAYGSEDFVLQLNLDYRKKLDKLGCKYVLHETDGTHSYENWRKYLLDFLPRLFKQ